MDTITTAIPTHRFPSSCYVCGAAACHSKCDKGQPCKEWAARLHEGQPLLSRPACQHDLTNAEADAAAREHDRRMTFARTPEAAYVATYRPY